VHKDEKQMYPEKSLKARNATELGNETSLYEDDDLPEKSRIVETCISLLRQQSESIWSPDNQNIQISKKLANTASKMKAISNVGERIQRIQYSYKKMFARKDALRLTNETATVQIEQLQKQNKKYVQFCDVEIVHDEETYDRGMMGSTQGANSPKIDES
jgi:hypothetical protein